MASWHILQSFNDSQCQGTNTSRNIADLSIVSEPNATAPAYGLERINKFFISSLQLGRRDICLGEEKLLNQRSTFSISRSGKHKKDISRNKKAI
ncbi:hypothetical protein GH733_013292 [Mirounga leonina]|nr:hypothetical protein GH733_013292 [Mirounga leonina]